jgi:hypothetical protein
MRFKMYDRRTPVNRTRARKIRESRGDPGMVPELI